MTPHAQQVLAHLERWRRRLELRRGLARMGRALLAGVVAAGAFAALAMLLPLPLGAAQPWWVAAGVLLVAALAGALAWAATRFDRADAAQVADLRHDGGALMTTAEGLLARQERGDALAPAEVACIERAAEAALEWHKRDVIPIRFGARWAVAPLALILAVTLPMLPYAESNTAHTEPPPDVAAADPIERVAKKLERPDAPPGIDPALRQNLRRLARRLRKGDLTQREATEQLGKLKTQARAERLKLASRRSQSSKGAQRAARELGRSPTTAKLARALSQAARPNASAAKRDAAARDAAERMRELKQLNRAQRQEAAERLKDASKASAAAGDPRLSELLDQASQALQRGDGTALDQLAESVDRQLRQLSQGESALDEVARALEEAQRRLDPASRPGQGKPGQGKPGHGDDSSISPKPRDWNQGKPGEPGDGKPRAGAGKGHSDTEDPNTKKAEGHQDAKRFKDGAVPKESTVDYKELYDAALLDDATRVFTKVKGERSGPGSADTVRGGQQNPTRAEQARGVLNRLPTSYGDEAREAIADEVVPPAYRDAVRTYFDPAQ